MDVSVAIPTLKESPEDIPTLESVPDGVPVSFRSESPIARARNAGVEETDAEYVVQLDDDVRFSRDLWDEVLAALDESTVVGMADWDFGLIVTRLIAFPRAAWADVGGFDERLGSHMEDTDFAIKLAKAGYDLEPIAQDRIEHVPHENRISTVDRAWRLMYLAGKHPGYVGRLLRGTLG